MLLLRRCAPGAGGHAPPRATYPGRGARHESLWQSLSSVIGVTHPQDTHVRERRRPLFPGSVQVELAEVWLSKESGMQCPFFAGMAQGYRAGLAQG